MTKLRVQALYLGIWLIAFAGLSPPSHAAFGSNDLGAQAARGEMAFESARNKSVEPSYPGRCGQGRKHFEQAMTLLRNQGYDGAITEFGLTIKLGCLKAKALDGRALANYKLGHFVEALADYSAAIQLDGHDANLFLDRGKVLDQLGRTKSAISDYNTAIHFDPTLAEAFASRALAWTKLKKLSKAKSDFDQAISLDPHSAPYRNNRGRFLVLQRKYDLAIIDLTAALAIWPDFFDAFENRAAAYARKGSYANAISDYSEEIRLRPDYATAYMDRGTAFSMLKKHSSAIEDFSKAISLQVNSPDALNARCWERAVSGVELEAALEDCTKALRLTPNDAQILDSQALVYLRLKKFREAWNNYDSYLRRHPKSANQLFGRGIAELNMGDASKGNSDIAAARRIDRNVDEVFHEYGIVTH